MLELTPASVPALSVEGLVKNYGNFCAVNEVSFSIQPGEIFGLLGPNGAGKTSIISVIVSLERPTAGRVEVFGHDVIKQTRQAKVRTGVVPQELINHGYFDVEEILHFHSGYFGVRNNKERIDYLMHRLALWDHRKKKVKQLSGGMKRRLLIAKALVHEPKLLLLDEPTAGVDVELRANLWGFVRELRNEGLSILLTTHYLEEAEELCDRVGILQQGNLRQVGETKELVRDLTQRTIHVQVKPGLPSMTHPLLIKQSEFELVFQTPSSLEVGGLLAELNIDLHKLKDISIVEGNLEDVFNRVLGG